MPSVRAFVRSPRAGWWAVVACVVLASTAFAQVPPHPPQGVTLNVLLARFAALPGLTAHFHEEKHIALLVVPLESDGVLDYAPPRRLARRVTAPSPSRLVIDGSRLWYGAEQGTQHIDLDASPVVRQFVDGFLALVAGNRASLDQAYTIDFQVADPHRPEAWAITLRPRLPAMAQVFRDIRLRGTGVALEWMSIRETNDDETTTTFSQVDTARHFTPDEIARIFTTPR